MDGWMDEHMGGDVGGYSNHCFFILSQGSHCPHHTKPDHAPPEGSDVLTSPPISEDCPHCVALSLRDGAGPAGTAANQEAEEGTVEDTDGQAGHSGEQKEERVCKGKCKELWMEMRIKLWGIVESKYFNRGIMIAILINTISMGIEHHEQVNQPPPPSWHTNTHWQTQLP